MKSRYIALYAVCSASLQLAGCVEPAEPGKAGTASTDQASLEDNLDGVIDIPMPTSRRYLCGYALPGFGCNNGRSHTVLDAVDMTSAITACHVAQPADRPDFCLVLDQTGTAATDERQCTAAGGSWRPASVCCNFLGSVSCPQ